MKQIFLLLFAFAAIGVNAQITAASTVTGSNSGDNDDATFVSGSIIIDLWHVD